jgi:hypothetical protein
MVPPRSGVLRATGDLNLAVLLMSANTKLVVECLAGQREAIVRQWLARAIQGYDPSTSRFLQQDQDGFCNPVGHALKENLPVLFGALLEDRIPATYQQNLDAIVRVRAVQDFSASEAVSFIFALKEIVRRELASQDQLDPHGSGCAAFESRIDAMALLAFDLYMGCREQVYEIKLNEGRRRAHVSEKMASKPTGRSKDSP